MASKRFIELNSLNRDRNKFPSPSNFNALFNQNSTISSNAYNSLDPVFESVPEYIFKSNQNNQEKWPSIESISCNGSTVKLNTCESNENDFYNGYHIAFSYFGSTGPSGSTGVTGATGLMYLNRVYDRQIIKYDGKTQTATLEHPLPYPTYCFSSTNTTYCLFDTNFNSNTNFSYNTNNNLAFNTVESPILSGTTGQNYKNNIVINVSGYPAPGITGSYGYFDNCYLLINDPNSQSSSVKPSFSYPSSSYNNVRKIIDTEYDLYSPNYLILYLDTELTFVPPNDTPCVITNYDPNLSVYPNVNTQFDNIYGKEDTRNGYDNYYNSYFMENIQTKEFRVVNSFDDDLNTAGIDSPFTETNNVGGIVNGSTGYIGYKDTYILRREKPIDYNSSFPTQIAPATVNIPGMGAVPIANVEGLGYKMVPSYSNLSMIGTSQSYIILNQNSNMSENFYKGLYIRMTTQTPNYNCMLNIMNYYPNIVVYNSNGQIVSTTPLRLIVVDIPNNVVFNPIYSIVSPLPQTYEILNFSRDNFNPISYSGNIVSQQESVLHNVELLSLMVPNKPLVNSHNIGSYPYFYVVFHTFNQTNKNVIYSNNSNSNKAVFIVKSITEDSNKNYSYLSLAGMKQTIKFKPNDNLVFAIYLPNGQPLEFIEKDNFSPYPPKDYLQISGVFSIERC